MAQTNALLDECMRVSADLDRLIADMQVGRPSQTRHEGHVDQAEAMAARLTRAARGPGRPVNRPIARTANGSLVW